MQNLDKSTFLIHCLKSDIEAKLTVSAANAVSAMKYQHHFCIALNILLIKKAENHLSSVK